MSPRATLEEIFFALLDDPSEEGLRAQLRAHPDATEKALALLRQRYVEGVAPEAPWESSPAFVTVLRLILGAGGPEAARSLIDLALSVAHPRALRPLSELVLSLVAPDVLAQALIDALVAGQPERARVNARDLAYHTFDAAGDDYAASGELRARLTDRLAAA